MATLDLNFPNSSCAVPTTAYTRTIMCKLCGKVRAYVMDPVGSIPNVFSFCPICGRPAYQAQDAESDMLEIWSHEIASKCAEGTPDLPIPLVRLLYEAWDWRESGSWFVDFAVKEIDKDE